MSEPEVGENMLGTCWTAPGRGATLKELLIAASESKANEGYFFKYSTIAQYKLGMRKDARTNLKLTGAIIQVYDLRRMEAVDIA